ncbi:MAG: hypothetical protein AAF491_00510 [Verrucomicrobiota bacterium]
MDDIPWLYVAMIFIAFASWVHNRIQEAREYRRARKIQKEKASRGKQANKTPEFTSPYREAPTTVPDSVDEVEAPKTFREVFQELERQFSEPDLEEPSARSKAKPPPLPSEPPAFSQPSIPDEPLVVTPPMAGPSRPSNSQKTSRYLVSSLKSGHKLKTALILKEVLDKPRALRSR